MPMSQKRGSAHLLLSGERFCQRRIRRLRKAADHSSAFLDATKANVAIQVQSHIRLQARSVKSNAPNT